MSKVSLEDITEGDTSKIQVSPQPTQKKEEVKDYCCISVPIKDTTGKYIGEYGQNLYEASIDEIFAWASRVCPALTEESIQTSLRQSFVQEENRVGIKATRDTFFKLVVEKHQQQLKFPKVNL